MYKENSIVSSSWVRESTWNLKFLDNFSWYNVSTYFNNFISHCWAFPSDPDWIKWIFNAYHLLQFEICSKPHRFETLNITSELWWLFPLFSYKKYKFERYTSKFLSIFIATCLIYQNQLFISIFCMYIHKILSWDQNDIR